MKTKRHLNRTTASLLALALVATSLFSLGGVVLAKDSSETEVEHTETTTTNTGSGGSETETETETSHTTVEARRQEVRQQAEQAKATAQAKVAAAKERLEGAKLKACEARQKGITTAMSQLTQRATNNLNVITKISDRVQAFYAQKGRTVANYDALVADVSTKKQLAEAAIASTKSVSEVFSCDGDSPQAAATQFRDAHKTAVAALKDYRTSVKNLIVAVKSAQSQTTTDGASPTTESQPEGATNNE